MSDRIVFPGSPWPDGHAITELEWSARLDPAAGLWFDLHVRSEKYPWTDAEADPDQDAWSQPIAWNNYGRCTLSSTAWGHRGFLAGTPSRPATFAGPVSFIVDDVAGPDAEPEEEDDFAFGIYLHGHDSTAHHRITLTPAGPAAADLEWHGRVALRYMDPMAPFRHEFHVTATRVPLTRITHPASLSPDGARALLSDVVDDPAELVALLQPRP